MNYKYKRVNVFFFRTPQNILFKILLDSKICGNSAKIKSINNIEYEHGELPIPTTIDDDLKKVVSVV